MASSRWKRFAFFEKNALSLPSEVLEDLIPVGESPLSPSFKGTGMNRSSSRRSMNHSESSPSENSNDRVNLVVTTAALPLDSKPTDDYNSSSSNSNNNPNSNSNSYNASNNANGNPNSDYAVALNDMWSSVTACNPMEGLAASGMASNNIHLPSQAQSFEDDSNVVSSGTAVDGLVLAFVTSCDTDRVHCFDISVRCNNQNGGSNKHSNEASNDSTILSSSGTTKNNSTTTGKSGKKRSDLEDLDGWRGYLAPMKQHQPQQQNAAAAAAANSNDSGAPQRSSEEHRIIGDHMGATGGANVTNNEGNRKQGIVGIATCRASSGHKPIHMACITATNLVVCVDPHLYLSW